MSGLIKVNDFKQSRLHERTPLCVVTAIPSGRFRKCSSRMSFLWDVFVLGGGKGDPLNIPYSSPLCSRYPLKVLDERSYGEGLTRQVKEQAQESGPQYYRLADERSRDRGPAGALTW